MMKVIRIALTHCHGIRPAVVSPSRLLLPATMARLRYYIYAIVSYIAAVLAQDYSIPAAWTVSGHVPLTLKLMLTKIWIYLCVEHFYLSRSQ